MFVRDSLARVLRLRTHQLLDSLQTPSVPADEPARGINSSVPPPAGESDNGRPRTPIATELRFVAGPAAAVIPVLRLTALERGPPAPLGWARCPAISAHESPEPSDSALRLDRWPVPIGGDISRECLTLRLPDRGLRYRSLVGFLDSIGNKHSASPKRELEGAPGENPFGSLWRYSDAPNRSRRW